MSTVSYRVLLLPGHSHITNVDGSALAEFIGFNVYRGSSPTDMMMVVSLTATAHTYAESNLTTAVWYWYVTAVNGVGTESAPSAMVTKTVVAPVPPVAITPAPPATAPTPASPPISPWPAPPAAAAAPPPAAATPVPAAVASAEVPAQAPASKEGEDNAEAGGTGSDDQAARESRSEDAHASPAALPADPLRSTRWSQRQHRTLCKPWGTVNC